MKKQANESIKFKRSNDPKCFTFNDINWSHTILLIVMHILALVHSYRSAFDPNYKWLTIFGLFMISLLTGQIGLVIAAHRYWSHRSFKAKLPLRLIMIFFQTMCLQRNILRWSLDHRTHHKYSDTDADPHNATRGFFYAHMGWIMLKPNDLVKQKEKTIDLSDLWEDPIVRFQHRFYMPLSILISIIIPTFIPYYLWNETLLNSFLAFVCFRFVYVLHLVGLVNSAAHLWGGRPYDKHIAPTENAITINFTGEGYHNYHHVFPYDYSGSEYGSTYFNIGTLIIDMFAKIGWAYDLKTPTSTMIEERKFRTGDGTVKQQNPFYSWLISLILFSIPITFPLMIRFLI